MIKQLYPSPSLLAMFDFDSFAPESITLDSNQINQAVRLSSRVRHQTEIWPAYLSFLALFGFQQWVRDASPNLEMDDSQCSLISTRSTHSTVICNVKVGAFRVCLIPIGSMFDPVVSLPQAIVEQADYVAHFYVLIEVQEECSQVNVKGFLRYDLLQRYLQLGLEQPQAEEYLLPLTYLDERSDQLMLLLECLDPNTITLPTSSAPFIISQAETTAIFLAHLLKPIVNVGRWLRNEMDDMAQYLNWILLPELVPAMRSGLRTPLEELESVILEVEQLMGTQLRPQARGAYQDIQLADTFLRLYAMTWTTVSPEGLTEWVLLLVLGSQPGYTMPLATCLQVSDASGVLVKQILEHPLNPTYLFAKIVGTLEEQFIVTISLANRTSVTLPPFAFQMEPNP